MKDGWVHFDMSEDDSEGICVSISEVTEQSAKIDIEVKVANTLPEVQPVTVRAVMLDADGVFVGGEELLTGIEAQDTASVRLTLVLSDPQLWNENKEPYLYTLHISLEAGDCKGVRTVAVKIQ